VAFFKYASARLIKSAINPAEWDVIRSQALSPAPDFRQKTAKVILQEYQPDDFLLSHCTIIASVDAEPVNQPLGRSMVDGFQIDRKFADYYITPATSKYINNNCFVSGTMILMSDGTEQPIEQIKVGDMVVTHTGAVRRVTETFVHPFRGQLSVIKRLGDQRLLEVSPEHPFYAMTPATVCACGCGTPLNRRSRKAAIHRFQDYAHKGPQKSRKNPKPDYTWVSAGFLEKGDFLSTPRLHGEEIPEGVTPGKARLLGYYLAEGFYHRQKHYRISQEYRDAFPSKDGESVPVGVSFALNLDETDTLVAEIRSLLQSEFGVGSSLQRVSDGGVAVHSQHSIELVRFFQKYATEYARTKKVSASVIQWPQHLQREVVRGWIEGDGCVESTAGGWVTMTSASPDLISQMHVIFGRLGIFATRGSSRLVGRKRIRVANGGVAIVPDHTKETIAYRLQVGSVHAEGLLGGSFLEGLFRRSIRNRKKHSLGFRVRDDRTMFPIRSVTKRAYEGKVFNFETEIDHSYVANGVAVHNSDAWERKLLLACFKTFIGAENYVEHIQIPELSKGKIIDAAARNIGDSIYVDILIATNRKHKPLIEAITSGKIGTLSMGCSVEFTTCTKCGNVAEDETHLCPHIRYFKGSEFVDDLGNKRKIAELCGHVESEPGSVKFIEASWVANPAFTGAVLRSILNPEEVEGLSKKIQVAFSEPARGPAQGGLAKAARAMSYDFNILRLAADYDDAANTGAQGETPAEGQAPSEPAKEPEEDPLHKVVKDLADVIREKAVKQVREELGKDEAAHLRGTPENRNDSLIKSALKNQVWRKIGRTVLGMTRDPAATKVLLAGLILHKTGGWKAVQRGNFTGRQILAISRVIDNMTKRSSMAGEARVYQTVIAVGGTSPYADVETYLAACRQVLGRSVTGSESGALLEKGRLYSLGS
jgi:hypothetical protein